MTQTAQQEIPSTQPGMAFAAFLVALAAVRTPDPIASPANNQIASRQNVT
jgi:hypothetical protein